MLSEIIYNYFDSLDSYKSKGPIKTLAKELSKVSLVVLIDEYNTSKVCPICQECKLTFPKIETKKMEKMI